MIIASDLIVIPIEASGASDWASHTTIQQVQEARQYKETLKAVFLVSRVIVNTVISRSIRDHVADHGIPLLQATVANRVPFAEALTMGRPFSSGLPIARRRGSFQLLCKKSERSMSKKSLTKPLPNRQPTSDEMDTFVKGGVGKDTEIQMSGNTEVKTSVKPENDARLTVDLPRRNIGASRLPARSRVRR